jgi:WD40 repeat protein
MLIRSALRLLMVVFLLAARAGAAAPPPKHSFALDSSSLPHGAIARFRIPTASPKRTLPVLRLAISPDGRELLTWAYRLDLWDVSAAKWKRTLAIKDYIGGTGPCYHPDGRTLLYLSGYGMINEYDRIKQKERRRWQAHQDAIVDLQLSADGKTLASLSVDQTVRLWELATRRERARFTDFYFGLRGRHPRIGLSPDGRFLALSRGDGDIRVIDCATTRTVCVIPQTSDSMAFSPDGNLLAVANHFVKAILFWNPADGRRYNKWKVSAQESLPYCLTFAPDGRTLAACSENGKIHVWEMASGQKVHCFRGHERAVNCLAVSPDSRSLASGGEDGTVLQWDLTGLCAKAPSAGRSVPEKQWDHLWHRWPAAMPPTPGGPCGRWSAIRKRACST